MDEIKREQLYNLNEMISNVKRNILEGPVRRETGKRMEISPQNQKILISFMDHLISKQISVLRVVKYIRFVFTIIEFCPKDLNEYTKSDVDIVMNRIRLKKYKLNSINDFITTIKVLFRFIEGLDDDDKSPRTKHLKKKKSECNLKREDLLTDEDMAKLISAASGIKDGLMYSCLLSVLRETGCRPGEIRGILLKDVVKNTHGYRINVDGKTGKRVVFAITSCPLLEKWLNAHIAKTTLEAPLFYYMKDGETQFIKNATFAKNIRIMGERALGKQITPYLFRHTMITNSVLKGIQDSKIRNLIGHAPGSKALSTYTHLCDEDSENAALLLAGIDIEQKKAENAFELKICPKCNAGISPHVAVCDKCGAVVNETAIVTEEMEKEARYRTLERLLELFDKNPKWFKFLERNLPKAVERKN